MTTHTIKLSDLVNLTKQAQLENVGVVVPCDGCVQCCQQKVHLTKEEQERLGIREIPLDHEGWCDFLNFGKCDIYYDRPLACRQYDCRPGFIVRALGHKPKIEPTTKHQVKIDDEMLLLKLVITTMTIIDMMAKDKSLNMQVWTSVVLSFEHAYENFREEFKY